MKNPIWKALFMLLVVVPLSIVAATMLWNGVLTQVVTIVGPINFWQMAGLMLLWYIMYPGTKDTIKSFKKNNE
jgi:hypothetical protein|tara:strand:- start:1099 stop:1317 length:219 start_codon:yes stop_codon:yes gene_type:complete